MSDTANDLRSQLLDAALMHVPFDGWSEATFKAAVADTDADMAMARALYPRGAVDLAIAFHNRGDAIMVDRMTTETLPDRYRDKVAAGVRFRIEAVSDKEAVRRGTTLFALPMYAPDGARLIWGTADHIWNALGDSSDDFNWYSKRAILSGVYSSTVLYWLGDDSLDNQATWSFLDRRIDNVMQIEKVKSQVNKSKVLSTLFAGPNWMMSQIKAPHKMGDFPGRWSPSQRSDQP